jgi:hypothetical protein
MDFICNSSEDLGSFQAEETFVAPALGSCLTSDELARLERIDIMRPSYDGFDIFLEAVSLISTA